MLSFSRKTPTPIAPQKKVSGLTDDRESAARGPSLHRSEDPSPQGPVTAPVGDLVNPSPSRVVGQ